MNDYFEYKEKEELRRQEKQFKCPHDSILCVQIRCKICGKMNTVYCKACDLNPKIAECICIKELNA